MVPSVCTNCCWAVAELMSTTKAFCPVPPAAAQTSSRATSPMPTLKVLMGGRGGLVGGGVALDPFVFFGRASPLREIVEPHADAVELPAGDEVLEGRHRGLPAVGRELGHGARLIEQDEDVERPGLRFFAIG